MDQAAVQLVKRKRGSIEKKSSLHLIVENLSERESFSSKKVQFLDFDAVWWITIGQCSIFDLSTHIRSLKFYLETNEYISKSLNWSYAVSATINDHDIESSTSKPIFKVQSNWKINISQSFFLKRSLNLKISVVISSIGDRDRLEKFVDKSAICKKIIDNNKCILSQSKYSDFTYIVQGETFNVHKNILGAASPVFDKVFSANMDETHANKCIINDIEPAIFKHLLNFIYTGKLPDFDKDNISRKLFEAAHYYEIQELKDICEQEEQFKLSVINAEDIYKWSALYELKDLTKNAWDIIKCDILEIFWPMEHLPPDVVSAFIATKKMHEKSRDEYMVGVREMQKTLKEFK